MNQLFFNRNIHIQDNKYQETGKPKQKNESIPHINQKDEMYSSYSFTPANNLFKASSINEGKQYKKFSLQKRKSNENKMHDEDHRIFLLMRKLETEKILNKKQKMEQQGDQMLQNQDPENEKSLIGAYKNENNSQKSQQVSNYSQSLSKKKNVLSFVKKSKNVNKKKCLSEKCQLQIQKNTESDQQVVLIKKHQRKLSINIQRQSVNQRQQKYPKIQIQDQYQKKITQRSIQASPSNKLNSRMTCQSCGKFLINMQIFCQKGALHYRKIKQELREAKQNNGILLKQMLELRDQIKKQLQNLTVSFIKLIKNMTTTQAEHSIKIKTQLDSLNYENNKNDDSYEKLNRSAIFSTHNQFHLPFKKHQEIFSKKKTQKSQVSTKTAGKIKKNYSMHHQQGQSPQSQKIKRKQNIQKPHLNNIRQSLHLQLKSKNSILAQIPTLPKDYRVNSGEMSFGKIVSRELAQTERQFKSSAATTDRINRKQGQIEDEKPMSQSFIKREENYQQCYSNIRDALNKIKLSFL